VLVENEREAVLGPLQALQAAAIEAALSPPVRSLEEAIVGYPSAGSLKTVRENMSRLKAATSLAQEIAEVSRMMVGPMRAVEKVAVAAERYMSDTEERIESKRQELEQAGGGVLTAAEADLAAVVDQL